MGDAIRFLLNGEPVSVENVPPDRTLLDWLRGDAGLTAAKEGCREGDCGACTVVLGRSRGGALDLIPVNACLVLLPMVDGRLVVTAEGLAEGGELHAVQRALVERHGSQCGFCTPGVAMSLMALQHAAEPKPAIHEALGGNLCRCTGYRSIAQAAADVCACEADDRYAREAAALAGQLESMARVETLVVEGDGQRFFAPVTLEALLALAAENPQARILGGGTDLGLLVTKQYQRLGTIIATDRVAEMKRIEESDDGLVIGGAVTYAEALPACERLAPRLGALIRRIGSRQIRSLGTLAGNIANASPIGDVIPPLLALDADVRLRSAGGTRVVLVRDFIAGYRKTAIEPGEVIESVAVPRPAAAARLFCGKVAKRFEQDISTVSASVLLTLDGNRVAAVRVAYGGLAERAMRAKALEAALTGRPWSREAIDAALPALAQDFAPIDDVRGSGAYRRTVAGNLIHRCFLETTRPDLAAEVMAL